MPDFALAHMLRGVSYALLALPNHGTVISKDDPSQEPFDKRKMAEDALEEFQLVLQVRLLHPHLHLSPLSKPDL